MSTIHGSFKVVVILTTCVQFLQGFIEDRIGYGFGRYIRGAKVDERVIGKQWVRLKSEGNMVYTGTEGASKHLTVLPTT